MNPNDSRVLDQILVELHILVRQNSEIITVLQFLQDATMSSLDNDQIKRLEAAWDQRIARDVLHRVEREMEDEQ